MEEKVREFKKNSAVSEIINFAGTKDEDFRKADIPTGREVSLEEKKMYFRKKRYARITVSVTAESGDAEFSKIVDEFNVHLDENRTVENVKTINKHLEDAKQLVDKLVKNWEGEI